MKNCKCSHCKKQFDYENYYGICPKCGTYNRKQETNVTMQNKAESSFKPEDNTQGNYTQGNYTQGAYRGGNAGDNTDTKKEFAKNPLSNDYIEETARRGKNIKLYVMSVALIIFAVAFLPLRYASIARQTDEFRANRDLIPIMCEAGEALEAPSGMLEVLEAVELIPQDTNPYFPEGKKLIGLKVRYTPEMKDNIYEIVWGMPMVEDANKNYKNAISIYDIEPFMSNTSIGSEQLFDDYFCYNYEQEEGYFTYLVDAGLTEVTVLLQQTENYEYLQIPKSVYQLTLPITAEEVEE